MDLSDPARNAFCCLSLRTAIWGIIFVDILYASLGIARIVAESSEQLYPQYISVLLTFSTLICTLSITGAIIGALGLVKSRARYVSLYASTLLARIAVSVASTGYALYNTQLICDDLSKELIHKVLVESESTERVQHIEKTRLRNIAKGGIVGSLVFLELSTDIVLLYFSYVVQSLAVWIKRGQPHPGDEAYPSNSLNITRPLLQAVI